MLHKDCFASLAMTTSFTRPAKSHYSLWLRSLSLVVAVAFLLQDVVYAQGGAPLWSHVSRPENDPRTLQNKLNRITIPPDAGLARKVVASGSGDVIINIQDAHSKLGAQESITKILDNLVRNYDLRLIALEGSADTIDTSLVSGFPVREVREKAGRYLLQEGRIGAGEFYSMISEEKVSLVGVEDPSLYSENLEVFKALVERKTAIRRELKGLRRAVRELEDKVYSPGLKALSENKLLHKNGGIQFTDYWARSEALAREKNVDIRRFPNLSKLVEAVGLEKEIDFRRAGAEREALVSELNRRLPKPELERLVLEALQFKQNKITPGAFHYTLAKMAEAARIAPEAYSHIIRYAQYAALYESIDLIAIFDEAERFEESLKEKLFRNDDERLLSRLGHCASILSQLLDTTLTSKDYEFYAKSGGSCEVESLRRDLQTLAEKYRTPVGTYVDFDALEKSLPDARRFYELATRRNDKLLRNTLARMKGEGTHVAALITGGFHSEGISRLMDEERLSYLVVMPKFDEKTPDRPYIAILTEKPKEYEEAFKDSDFYIMANSLFDAMERPGDERARMEAAAVVLGLAMEHFDRRISERAYTEYVAALAASFAAMIKKKRAVAGTLLTPGVIDQVLRESLARKNLTMRKNAANENEYTLSFPHPDPANLYREVYRVTFGEKGPRVEWVGTMEWKAETVMARPTEVSLRGAGGDEAIFVSDKDRHAPSSKGLAMT
ncbi:MAG: hypothetical protein HYT89_05895, partial [Candidatus Omnitrophica bacterium]|nr:hypothetical protein [Candidatus Omnitrophota bacterium]